MPLNFKGTVGNVAANLKLAWWYQHVSWEIVICAYNFPRRFFLDRVINCGIKHETFGRRRNEELFHIYQLTNLPTWNRFDPVLTQNSQFDLSNLIHTFFRQRKPIMTMIAPYGQATSSSAYHDGCRMLQTSDIQPLSMNDRPIITVLRDATMMINKNDSSSITTKADTNAQPRRKGILSRGKEQGQPCSPISSSEEGNKKKRNNDKLK